METNKNDENLKKENNELNKSNNILSNLVYSISFMIAFLVVSGVTRSCVSSFKNNRYSKQDMQMMKDAGFVKGFEIVNTVALHDYCSDSGYIPQLYIDKFQSQYIKTISNTNEILAKFGTQEEINRNLVDKIYEGAIDVLEADFNNVHSQYDVSKKEYCKLFDDESDEILSEKLQVFKEQRPNMYLD